MMQRPRLSLFAVWTALAAAPAALSGCHSPAAEDNAPLASASALPAPTAPQAPTVATFVIDSAPSQALMSMDAPLEKISGRVPGGLEGHLDVDLADLTRSTGFLAADLGRLELQQSVKDEESGEFLESTQNGLQNEHARAWLEIGADAPEDMQKRYRRVEFAIREISDPSEKNVAAMKGNERKVTFIAKGDFLLHGKKATKTVNLEATFHYKDDKPVSVSVRSLSPLVVNLSDHDVRPREAYAVLAQQTLDLLAPKVAREAEIRIQVTALVPGGDAPLAPAASAAAPEATDAGAGGAGGGSGAGGGAPAGEEEGAEPDKGTVPGAVDKPPPPVVPESKAPPEAPKPPVDKTAPPPAAPGGI